LRRGTEKMKRHRWIVLLIIGVFLLISCAAHFALDEAQRKWDAMGIRHYRITVRHIESIWHLQTYEMEVDGSEITHSAKCSPAPTEGGICEVNVYDPADYTVEGLFETAKDLLEGKYMKWVKVEFDEEYGYPTIISIDDPELLDEDSAWKVIEFERLP